MVFSRFSLKLGKDGYTEKYETREKAKQSIFHYIEIYYNRIRRHSILGFIAPDAFEQQFKVAA